MEFKKIRYYSFCKEHYPDFSKKKGTWKLSQKGETCDYKYGRNPRCSGMAIYDYWPGEIGETME